jgi:peptide-methionine (S)-S-oxide reductase
MKTIQLTIIFSVVAIFFSCAQEQKTNTNAMTTNNLETAFFGGGCFWCTEAVFENTEGVKEVIPGYSGGKVKNPSYDQVCSGATGHAEVVKIKYDPQKVSYTDLLFIFFKTHNPTTLNRQGADIGTQYRSAIFYMSEEQKQLAGEMIKELEKKNIWEKPIVTEVSGYKNFYEAENYHQNFYQNNKSHPYCNFVISPKLEKFKKEFKEKVK